MREVRMRRPRDFQVGHLYAVTQKGNRGQWVYVDAEDFRKAIALLRYYAALHGVRVHVWCLVHNHGHWVLEASSKTAISNVMRDVQGRYSRYLNLKYAKEPWRLWGVLRSRGKGKKFSKFLRAGPVNWTPRFHAELLDRAGAMSFMRDVELNSVRAGLVKRPERWRWSSCAAHFAGTDGEGLLCLERWRWFFGEPAEAAERWREYVECEFAGEAERRARVRRLQMRAPYNRPRGWMAPLTPAVIRGAAERSAGAGSTPT